MLTLFPHREHQHPTTQRYGEGNDDQTAWAWRIRRGMTVVAMAVVPLIALLANSQLRHWIIEVMTAACVLGGMIAAPVLALVGWIGLILPEQVPLHRASTTLFAVAIVWVAAALIGAHWYSITQRPGH